MSDIPKEHNQRVQQKLAEQGIELTHDEIDYNRGEAWKAIRTRAIELGFNPPTGDYEFLVWLNSILSKK